ncbi:plasmid pRiA4b ORF-3 family protein [Arthrobacter sp. NPDC057388]|uniref:plasmid pRiA4b ORF-3 family protein n=1 Tax=Arthrobacter sp. NPDC057388 TaxID=3346116 RepID=UPI003639CE81
MQSTNVVPGFDLRVSIQGTDPEIWRRLQLPAALTVPQFHLAVQAAFGWEDRHLYGIRYMDRKGRPAVLAGPDFETEESEAAAVSGVVLSDLLDAKRPGRSRIEYEYDFGDCWTHEVELLGAVDLAAGELTCVDGASRGPVEDSGGAAGYTRLVQILADRNHPEYQEARSWVFQLTGDIGPQFDASVFDPHGVNRKLRNLSLQWWPQPLSDGERDAVLLPVRWLLEQASPDGVELTKDGYLKPAMVLRAVEELGWSGLVVGKANREANAIPVMELREHVVKWRLLRKFKGRLVLTPAGRRALERPADLWDLVIDKIGRPEHDAVYLVTRLYAFWHLSGIAPPWNRKVEAIRAALEAAGFVTRSGHPIPDSWASDINQTVRRALDCLHLMEPEGSFRRRGLLTDGGVKFFLQVSQVLNGRPTTAE